MKIIIDKDVLLNEVPSGLQDALMLITEDAKFLPKAKKALAYFVTDDEGQRIEKDTALELLDEMPYNKIFALLGSVNKAVGEALVPLVSETA